MTERLFELFDAPLSDAADYIGRARCDLCQQDVEHCFSAELGPDFFVPCPVCSQLTMVTSRPALALRCPACRKFFDSPELPDTPTFCASCLLAGRAATTMDTELGMVRWEDAVTGWTHGLPGFSSDEWEVSAPNQDGWSKVRVPEEHLMKLVRTPPYSTIQGERWMFCCHQPMVFTGRWTRERFTREAPDGDGSLLLDQCLGEHVPGLWEDELHDITGIYAFQCARCRKRRAHWDIA